MAITHAKSAEVVDVRPLDRTPKDTKTTTQVAKIVAACVSSGGVPKWPLAVAQVTQEGVEGDGHAHAKHNRHDRAISIFDIEIMWDLIREGFPLEPGTAGENLTVERLHVQQMEVGTLLGIGEVVLRLEKPRKPCFVLDVIDPRLKDAIAGRCGYMASVLRGGTIRPGMTIHRIHDSGIERDNPSQTLGELAAAAGTSLARASAAIRTTVN